MDDYSKRKPWPLPGAPAPRGEGEGRRIIADPVYWQDEFTRQAQEAEQRELERQQREQGISLREREYRAQLAERHLAELKYTDEEQRLLRAATAAEVEAARLRQGTLFSCLGTAVVSGALGAVCVAALRGLFGKTEAEDEGGDE